MAAPLGLSYAELGKRVARMIKKCKPVGTAKCRKGGQPKRPKDVWINDGTSTLHPSPCPTTVWINDGITTSHPSSLKHGGCTLDSSTLKRPEVTEWGKILSEVVGYEKDDIPAESLAYAFEVHAGPSKKDPGCLLRSLMRRFEHCVGVGDALRDATTSAKVNGCITDFSWENHIRPFFEKVRELLLFEQAITESAAAANARRAGMVPYVDIITWPVGKSKEYPKGRSVLTSIMKPQLAELVRSYSHLAGILGHLFHHNLEGVATDVREQVKLVVSWIIDATVIGKSKLGNKNEILHHTRGGLKLIVNGRASRSPYSIEEFLLMTGNDHFLEICQALSRIQIRKRFNLCGNNLLTF